MKEHQHVEWKESWRDEYLKWICGFANAEGGVLEIGPNDAGTIIGLADAARLLEEIPNKVRDVLGIMVDVNLHHQAGRDWLAIHVPAYPSPVSYKGEYHYRSGSTKQELKGAALTRFLLRKQGLHWDGVPLPRLTLADCQPTALQKFRSKAARSGRVDEAVLADDDTALLASLQLLDEDQHLQRATALLFGRQPERWTLEKLLGKHPSNPFNPLLASAFFRAGYVESWGRGIEKICRECREHHLPPPVFDPSLSGLMVTLQANPAHVPKTLAGQVTGQVTEQVTPEVQRLVACLVAPMSRAELQQALGLAHRDHFTQAYLAPALVDGWVAMTLPDKPKSRLQKYQLTEQGRALLKEIQASR